MDSFAFTQCVAVLFDRAPSLEELERALAEYAIVGRPKQGEGDDAWAMSGPGFVVQLRPGVFAVVDVVERPWPDDPAAAETTAALGSAWRAGAFGPALPGVLARAVDQPWLWSGGAGAVARHRGFVRLRTGRALAKDAPAKLPEGYDPVYELASLTALAQSVMHVPAALAFFAPAGEALRSVEQLDAALSRKAGLGAPPFELWVNVRAMALPEEDGVRWLLLDVVGMGQLRLPDQEAIFAEGQEEPQAVEALLRSACLHLVSGRPIAPDSTSDDVRGRRWRASAATGIVAPQRPVLRWLPEQSARAPEAMIARLSPAEGGPG